MKRYIVFRYSQYYPSGGWNDVLSSEENTPRSFDTKEEAVTAALEDDGDPDYVQVVDIQEGKLVVEKVADWLKEG